MILYRFFLKLVQSLYSRIPLSRRMLLHMDARTHWEKLYSTKARDKMSWYRPHLFPLDPGQDHAEISFASRNAARNPSSRLQLFRTRAAINRARSLRVLHRAPDFWRLPWPLFIFMFFDCSRRWQQDDFSINCSAFSPELLC